MYPQIVFVHEKMPVLMDRVKALGILPSYWPYETAKHAQFISILEDRLRSNLPRLIALYGEDVTKDALPDWEWDWKRNCWRLIFRIPVRAVEVDHRVVLLSACTYQTDFGWRTEETTGGSRVEGLLPANSGKDED
ncbi:hypothetical protein H2201_001595 [Coniosporium apollinis]|uniref:Uncharacterized protein n=1 Tax=Coniosporium apollinis TaxID=61459 RepID=A0ABQ9P4D2_9PEZI|nr:hypothetical protein H2201_001595 [Coniosporium apollinis]